MYNIFGLKWCIFCLRAINFMQEKGLEFHYHPTDNQEAFLNHLKEQNGQVFQKNTKFNKRFSKDPIEGI